MHVEAVEHLMAVFQHTVLNHLAGYPPAPSSELMDAVDFALRRMAAWLLTVSTTLISLLLFVDAFQQPFFCGMQQSCNMPCCLQLLRQSM